MAQGYPVSAIARLLKITERRVQQLVKEGILPRAVKGIYDPIPCVHTYIDYLKRLAAGNGELSLTDERTRLTKYQADLAEIELKKAHGDVISTKVAMRLWGEVIMSTRQRLLGLPTRLAPLVATSQSLPEIKERIESAIYEVLTELVNPNLSEYDRRDTGSTEDTPELPAPTSANGKPVGRQKKKTLTRK